MYKLFLLAYYRINRAALARQRANYLKDARFAADWLWSLRGPERRNGISIDDVRRLVGAPPLGVDPRINGAVFIASRGWKAMTYAASCRTVCHHRPVARFYKLAD